MNDVVEVGQWLKSIHPDIPLRINTNGLSDLVFGEPTASRLAGIFDTVSNFRPVILGKKFFY